MIIFGGLVRFDFRVLLIELKVCICVIWKFKRIDFKIVCIVLLFLIIIIFMFFMVRLKVVWCFIVRVFYFLNVCIKIGLV